MEKGSLMLVYDYMENGSLDKRVFQYDKDSQILSYQDRIQTLKQVASGVLYLQYGWESKVLHRVIKPTNVLLDKENNTILGDFRLARMHDHDKVAATTRVLGTVGYFAPEVLTSGKASTQTDVFGYRVLIFEVMCGRRPLEKPPSLEWVRNLWRNGDFLFAVDARVPSQGKVNDEEVMKLLQLGLLCTLSEATASPTMKQVVKVFEVQESPRPVSWETPVGVPSYYLLRALP